MAIKLEGNPDDMTQGVAGLSVQNSSKGRIKKIHEACVSCSIKRLSVKREGTCFKYHIRDHNKGNGEVMQRNIMGFQYQTAEHLICLLQHHMV